MVKLAIINRAVEEAKKSDVVRGKVGAVLFSNSGRIIVSSHNVIFLGQMAKKIFTIHAEKFLLAKAFRIKAIQRFGRNERLNVFVLRYRVGLDTLGSAKPCGLCTALLKAAGVNVYYTNSQGNIEKLNWKKEK